MKKVEHYKMKHQEHFWNCKFTSNSIYKKIWKIGDIEIENQNIHQYKRPISIKKIDIDKIVVSNKALFGKKGSKYFIGY